MQFVQLNPPQNQKKVQKCQIQHFQWAIMLRWRTSWNSTHDSSLANDDPTPMMVLVFALVLSPQQQGPRVSLKTGDSQLWLKMTRTPIVLLYDKLNLDLSHQEMKQQPHTTKANHILLQSEEPLTWFIHHMTFTTAAASHFHFQLTNTVRLCRHFAIHQSHRSRITLEQSKYVTEHAKKGLNFRQKRAWGVPQGHAQVAVKPLVSHKCNSQQNLYTKNHQSGVWCGQHLRQNVLKK